MSETGSDTRTGIGARLRAGREKMGLTQLQTAEKLHVDPKVVESLEAEAFDVLGAPVFVRGHLKHYAELIGEQTAELHELYAAATKPVLPDLTRLPKAAPASNPSRLAVPALVVLIGFVLVGVVFWVVKSVGGPEGDKPKRGPQPVVIAPDSASDSPVANDAPDAAAPAGGAEATSGPGAGRANEASNSAAGGRSPGNVPGGTSPANAARSPSAVVLSQSGGATGRAPSAAPGTGAARQPPSAASAPAGGGAAASSAAAAPEASAAAATSQRIPAKPMEVTLRFAADSWVEVYDANGEKLFYDVGAADSSHTVSGTPPFRVHVANAPGVTLDVNGKPAAVPANALKGDEAQFTINRAGRIVRATPQADGG